MKKLSKQDKQYMQLYTDLDTVEHTVRNMREEIRESFCDQHRDVKEIIDLVSEIKRILIGVGCGVVTVMVFMLIGGLL